MKKYLPILPLLAALVLFAGCQSIHTDKPNTDASNNSDYTTKNWFVEGLYLKCDTGEDMIITDPVGENAVFPCVMSPKDDSVSFDNLTDGDKIKIEVFAIEETYPARTKVHSIAKISDGKKSDIPANIMASLKELGWVTQPIEVVEIIDIAKRDNLDCDDALQQFYSDAEYNYFYPSIKSEYVVVKYSDNTEETVENALKNGKIAISDLDRFEIKYFKEKK